MKIFAVLLLAGSMALNVTFAVLLLMERFGPPPARPTAPAVVDNVMPAPPIDAKAWLALQSAHLPEMLTRLQEEGFPPALVQAILAAQINEAFRARRQALIGAAEDAPFWSERMRDPKLQLALRQLDREQRQLLRDALGREPDEAANLALYRHKNLAFLPEDKAAAVRRLLREQEERRSDLYAAGYSQSTDAQKIKALEKEHEAALAAVLTPAEFQEYNLRSSRTAETLREELSAFTPTEQEFRAIHALRAAFDERFPQEGIVLMNAGDERSRAQKEMNEQIKTLLGPERGTDYEKKTDYNYRRTSQLVARLELPPAIADQVWAIQKEVENQRRDLYANRPGLPEVTEKMTTLHKQAIARLTPLLGERGLESYYQYGGSWLQSLVPRPRMATPPASTGERKK